MNINDLPNEIIDLVLSYVKITDLWICREVCKKWNQLVITKKLMRDNTIICINDQNDLDLVLKSGITTAVSSLKLTEISSFNFHTNTSWIEFMNKLNVLSIDSMDKELNVFQLLLGTFSLRQLRFEDCDFMSFKTFYQELTIEEKKQLVINMKNVTLLSLKSIEDLNDEIISIFDEIFPNIETLILNEDNYCSSSWSSEYLIKFIR